MEKEFIGEQIPGREDISQVRRVRPWLAGLLAWLFPGVGHLYAGHVRMGVLVLACWLLVANVAYVLVVYWDAAPYNIIAFPVLLIGFACVNIVSAVKLAKLPGANRARMQAIKVIGLIVASTVLSAFAIPIFGEYEAFRVPSGSMEDALFVGDYFLADMSAFDGRDPGLMEIAICEGPRGLPGVRNVKRCVGLPGDTIEFRETEILRNGSRLTKVTTMKNIGSKENSRANPAEPYVVPPDHFFFVGDNLDNSYDSRHFGAIQRDLLVGKPLRIHWSRSLNRIGLRVQ